MFYWLLKILLGPLVKFVWVAEIKGKENISPEGPLIIAANHSSYFDFLTLVALFPRRIRFLAAEVFYKSNFWKPVMVLTGQIKVDRNAKDKSEVKKEVGIALRRGEVIGVFPEGTRSRTGKLQRSYSGVAKFALNNETNILPVAIRGAFEVMAPNDKKPKFKKIIKISFLPILEYKSFRNYTPEKITHEMLMPKIGREIKQEYPKDQE